MAQVQPSATTGVRPFNPLRDFPAVASILVRTFGSELKLDSLATDRLLRWTARYPSLAWFWFGADSWFDSSLMGFVWVDENRVVGNANISQISTSGDKWILSNVAVEPEFRGRGIGKALVRSCLDYVAARGGGTVLLQVWQSNHVARRLYEPEGFRTIGMTWRLINSGCDERQYAEEVKVPRGWSLRPARNTDLPTLAGLAGALLSRQAQWLRPPNVGPFRSDLWDWLKALLSPYSGFAREVACCDAKVQGGLALRDGGNHRYRLTAILAKDAEESAASFMAKRAAQMCVLARGQEVICDLPGALPFFRDELISVGFQEKDSLLQMLAEIG